MYLSYAVEMSVNNLFKNKLVLKKLVATFLSEKFKTQNIHYIQKL